MTTTNGPWLGPIRAGDPATDAALRRSLGLLALVTLVTAWFSETFFHPDEHFQILEFLGYKLGRTAAADLPWEYRAGIRPWMQPFLYYLIARPLTLVGVSDPFVIVRILRLLTGALSLGALAALATAAVRGFARTDERRVYAKTLIVFGFLPYLFVRTSSETLSAALFTLGFAILLNDAAGAGRGRLLTAGLLIGTAVECRYQVALMAFGLYLWLAIVARVGVWRLAWLALGSVVPVLVALPVDCWGYGVWCFPPWTYFAENILNGTAARDYGTDPVYGYLYLLLPNLFAPVALVVLVSALVAWARRPRHAVTWTMLPFVLVQSLLAHKEERFLFPVLILATMLPVLAFAPGARPGWTDRVWGWRHSVAAKGVAVLTWAMMLLIAVHPIGYRPDIPMARHIYRQYPGGFAAVTLEDKPFASYPIYRPRRFVVRHLPSVAALRAVVDRGPVLLLAETPVVTLPPGMAAQRLFSELPFADVPVVADTAMRLKARYDALPAGGLPHLSWQTLYRVSSAAAEGQPAGATPAPGR